MFRKIAQHCHGEQLGAEPSEEAERCGSLNEGSGQTGELFRKNQSGGARDWLNTLGEGGGSDVEARGLDGARAFSTEVGTQERKLCEW